MKCGIVKHVFFWVAVLCSLQKANILEEYIGAMFWAKV
jgi:hypothetical protein